ncbi:hypothetical protein ACFQBQ_02640 [Granulicella cerasi]|uniref:DUF4157 domain-containing protein n=1 Tax=Granulicella cerasi TaxID=741063 RepID=A0ABW1Z6K5_9BACT|nr:hypothetical protein [Granulicella cerasi]
MSKRLGALVLACGLYGGVAGAQAVETPKTPNSSTPASGAPKGVDTPPVLQSGQTSIAVDGKLTDAQKRDIEASKEQIFQFVSKDSGLAIHTPVKLVFATRDGVNRELRTKFDEDKGNKRMERSELVLKKFGMLDRDFQLRPFLLSLLTEQIAGYYDNKTKQMTLLDWVPVDEQKPVLAHELTHALQDQRMNLRKWQDPEPDGLAKNVKEDNEHIATDEAGTAREAVLEGQAMVTFADYYLDTHGFQGKTLKDVPQMATMLAGGAGDSSDSPILSRAPLVLQQAMLFPYREGMLFEASVVSQKGVQRGFAGVLDAPPSASAQVLHPDTYLAKALVPVLHLPDLHPTLKAKGWLPYDVGVMGELDVRMTAELFGGRPLAEALAPNWAGGVYLAAQRKDASEADKKSTKSIGLLYLSHWKNESSAQSFFTVFDQEFPRQYGGLQRRQAEEKDENERVYSTREGDLLLVRAGSSVWVSEGFDLPTARAMREQVEAANPAAGGPMMQAKRDARDEMRGASGPVTGLASWIGEFGMMKAALK